MMDELEIKDLSSNLENAYASLNREHQYETILINDPSDRPNKQDSHEIDSARDEYSHTIPQQLEPSAGCDRKSPNQKEVGAKDDTCGDQDSSITKLLEESGQTVFKSKEIHAGDHSTIHHSGGTTSFKILLSRQTSEDSDYVEPDSNAPQYTNITDIPRVEQHTSDKPKENEYLEMGAYDEIHDIPNENEYVDPTTGKKSRIIPERKGTLPVPAKPPGESPRHSRHRREVLIIVLNVLTVVTVLTVGATLGLYFSIDRHEESTQVTVELKTTLTPEATEVRPGDNISFNCTVQGLVGGQSFLRIRKFFMDKTIDIATNNNLLPAFSAPRYKIELLNVTEAPDDVLKFKFTITDAHLGDSGEYECAILGSNGLLADSRKQITVLNPTQEDIAALFSGIS